MAHHRTEFEQLMADVAAGSEEAAWQVVEVYTPHILNAVRRSLGPKLRRKLDSLDVAQTLWASIFFKRIDLTRLKTPQELTAFLARAAKNKVIDKARFYHRQKQDIRREESLIAGPTSSGQAITLYSKDSTPSARASVRDLKARWSALVERCSDRDQKIVTLRQRGESYEEIGVALAISRDKARRVIDRLMCEFSESE